MNKTTIQLLLVLACWLAGGTAAAQLVDRATFDQRLAEARAWGGGGSLKAPARAASSTIELSEAPFTLADFRITPGEEVTLALHFNTAVMAAYRTPRCPRIGQVTIHLPDGLTVTEVEAGASMTSSQSKSIGVMGNFEAATGNLYVAGMGLFTATDMNYFPTGNLEYALITVQADATMAADDYSLTMSDMVFCMADAPSDFSYAGSTTTVAEVGLYYVTYTPTTTGGVVSVDKTRAACGETITVTTSPLAGYQLESVVVSSPNYTPALTAIGNGQYTFVMPADDVTVTAIYGLKDLYGDVNADHVVDVTDVNILIDIVLHKDQASNYAGPCDVNDDGVIDVRDVNEVIKVVLGEYVDTSAAPTTTTFTVAGVSFTMVNVEGGTFARSTTSRIILNGFSIGQTEVTQELWMAVMGSNPSYFQQSTNSSYGDDPQRPVEQVSWDDCQVFINRLNALTGANFRLPTEAEWEYAARGGMYTHGYTYAGSNTLGNVAVYGVNRTAAVGTKAPNELGIYDMSGNVGEWCQDWYNSYPTDKLLINPTGPETGTNRTYRGGYYSVSSGTSNYTSYFTVSKRYSSTPTNKYQYIGLRLAM